MNKYQTSHFVTLQLLMYDSALHSVPDDVVRHTRAQEITLPQSFCRVKSTSLRILLCFRRFEQDAM